MSAMPDDLLGAATAALRAVGQDAGVERAPMAGAMAGLTAGSMAGSTARSTAESTRRRVMASLGPARASHRRRLAFAVFALALSTATLSWAASTGRLVRVLQRLHVVDGGPPVTPPVRPPIVAPPRVAVAAAPRALPVVAAAPIVPVVVDAAPAPVVVEAAPVAPVAAVAAPVVAVAPRPRRSRPRLATAAPVASALAPVAFDADLAAYRAAHTLHFRGADVAAAVAAWDAYLAAYPAGRFAVDAAYNRAIGLVRLGRTAAARAALAPFAAGEVAGGYRRAEAARLLEALP